MIVLSILFAGVVSYLMPTQGVKPGPNEPQDLADLVEYPEEAVSLWDIKDDTEKHAEFERIQESVEGFLEISSFLQAKGYHFEFTGLNCPVTKVEGVIAGTFFSCWSEMGPNGTRALIIAALMEDGTSMVMGAITNLLPPQLVPGVDPYIIVNAQPYIFISWYWWVPSPVDAIHPWYYWWYDSHSHPNWFWSVYWWWRTDVAYYYLTPYGKPYLPWWWLFWHWTYWRHWYWWSTYFPYDR